jgi:hypothetical protein
MATGLFRRQAPDGQAADNPANDADSTTEVTTSPREPVRPESTARVATTDAATERERAADAAAERERAADPDGPTPHNRIVGQRVPPGGAVAPLPPSGTPVPPGGAVAPPSDDTRPISTGVAPSLTKRDHSETVTERERIDAAADRNAAASRDAAADGAQRRRRARTSFTATISLIMGVSATLAALSGRLAPVAVVIGAVGLLIAGLGMAEVSRRHVTGHHVALLGLAFSIAGVALGILAINRFAPWLDGGADQVSRLRDWLDAHFAWLRHF